MATLIFRTKKSKNKDNNFIEIDSTNLVSGIYEQPIELSNFPSKKIGSKSILEWFAVNDVSFWWLVAPTFYPKIIEASIFVEQLLKLINEKDIKKIIVESDFDKINLIQQVALLNGIKVDINNKLHLKFKIKNSTLNIIKGRAYKKITQQKFKKRLTTFEKKKREIPKSVDVIISSAGAYRRKSFNEKTGSYIKSEFMIQPFLDLLSEKKISHLCLDLDYTFRGTTKILEERLTTPHNWIPVEFLLKKKDPQVKEILSKLESSIKDLLEIKNVDALNFKNISLWEFIKPLLKEVFFEPFLPTYLQTIYSSEKFLRKLQPKILIQVYEAGPYAKAFQITSEKLGIRTIGIQHGLISEKQFDYIFKEIRTKEIPLGNPIPTETWVYGEYYKEILVKQGSYPSNKIKIVGNPSFYNWNSQKKFLDKKTLKQKIGVQDKNLLLIPLSFKLTENFQETLDFLLLNNLWKLFKEENIIIYVRPHPTDIVNAKTQLNLFFPNNQFLISKLSLFEDIAASDIVITTLSTVSIDSTIFKKPIIFAFFQDDFKRLFDFQKYMIDNEVAIVSKPENLKENISSILKEGWNGDEKKKKHFLKSFFNLEEKIDLLQLIIPSYNSKMTSK